MRKILFALLALIVLGGAAAVLAAVQYRPDRAIRVATEHIAHTLCTATFVSGLDPDQVYRETLRPARGIRVLNRGIRYNVDKLRK